MCVCVARQIHFHQASKGDNPTINCIYGELPGVRS